MTKLKKTKGKKDRVSELMLVDIFFNTRKAYMYSKVNLNLNYAQLFNGFLFSGMVIAFVGLMLGNIMGILGGMGLGCIGFLMVNYQLKKIPKIFNDEIKDLNDIMKKLLEK